MTITTEEIARLRALEAKATPGPWRKDDRHSPSPHCVSSGDHVADVVSTSCSGMEGGGFERDEDRMLSIASRNALPRLLDEIERLRADLREAMALLQLARPDLHGHLWRERCDALLAKHKEEA